MDPHQTVWAIPDIMNAQGVIIMQYCTLKTGVIDVDGRLIEFYFPIYFYILVI